VIQTVITGRMLFPLRSYLTKFWRSYVLVLAPFLLLPILFNGIPNEVRPKTVIGSFSQCTNAMDIGTMLGNKIMH
jgi:hypothetical protein